MATYNTTKWLVSTIATISLSTPLIYAWSGLIASPNDTLDASKWNDLVNVAQTAYNWGNHGTAGYLTGETDPTVKSFAKATLPNCAADQVLKGDGSSLSCVTDSTTADNLGNHTATQNIKLSGYYLSNDWDSEGVFVTTAGAVGIGTTSPVGKFNVQGFMSASIPANGVAFELLDASHSNAGTFNIYGGNASGWSVVRLQTVNTNSLAIETGGAERLRVDTSGNVGIGVTNPWAKLEVAGSVKLGNGGETCNSGNAGLIRYNISNSKHEGCNGAAWIALY